MEFRIQHETEYTFEQPVFLEPHIIRLWPRPGPAQRTLEYAVTLSPEPTVRSEVLDEHGNIVTHAWFEELTETLTVRAEGRVETLRNNPFDYLLEPESDSLPLDLPGNLSASLHPYLQSKGTVATLASALAKEADNELIPFLDAVTNHLYKNIRVEERDEGDPQASTATLESGVGACRDLSVVFIDLCNAQGVPARFVSGYERGVQEQDRRHLHGWAEVFVPGGGWRGYDPTHGLVVADQHIVLAAGAPPHTTLPVAGTYRGTDIKSSMRTQVEISV